jgi:ATP-dependent DNA helicase RecG
MTETELKSFIQERFPKENEGCEWKQFKNLKHAVSSRSGEDIVSYVSAFANMNGGVLVMGVKDETLEIIGIQNTHSYSPENLPQNLIDKCLNLSTEGLRVNEYITADTNKKVWILHIPRHAPRKPVYAHGQAWQRIGDSITKIREQRERAILSEPLHNFSDWSSEIIDNIGIEVLDQNAVAFARQQYIEKFPSYAEELQEWDDITFLNKAHLTKNGQITRTSILLLGKPESLHYLDLSLSPSITWSLKSHDGKDIDYQHFSIPLLLSSEQAARKIRNLKYRYLKDDTLFPTEINMYDNYIIRESIQNCIAHQDYVQDRRINIVEYPEEILFTNAGSFIPGSVEEVISMDAPPDKYRNPFLAKAMFNLNMIDQQGGGIRRMFNIQRSRFFPMPDYDLTTPNTVRVKIFGKILDENYTRLLINQSDLDLKTVIQLDYIQKGRGELLSKEQIQRLRSNKLIEGRKPNYFIASRVAKITGQQSEYIRLRGIDDDYCKKVIIDYLDEFGSGRRSNFEEILIDRLPGVLSLQQKKNKIQNILQALRQEGIISVDGKTWTLSDGRNQ